jgi:hypothetical protein
VTHAPGVVVGLIAGLLALGLSCKKPAPDSTPPANVSDLCSQPIPHSADSLFEVVFSGEFAFTSNPWGYIISDSPGSLTIPALRELPKGRLFKVTSDGTVHLASFAPYDPKTGEITFRHVVHGVPIAETIFHTDGSGWHRDPDRTFEDIELADDHLIFTHVKDDKGVLIAARQAFDTGSILAQGKDGLVQALELRHIDPDPARSPPSTRRRLAYQIWTPSSAHPLPLSQLPSRGICKPVALGRR